MPRQPTPNTYQDERSVEIAQQNVEHGRNLGAATIAYAAKQQGATLEWITKRDVWATLNGRRVAIAGHHGTESALSSGIEGDKVLAKTLMKSAGISVPAGRRVSSAEDAVQAQLEIGRPVVIKPVNGIMGRGVTVNVTSSEDIRAGFLRAAGPGLSVMVEQYIDVAAEYRAHATPTECVGVFRRLLPSITGDGDSTIAELIEQKNELRRHNPSTRPYPIPMDDVAEGFLRRRRLTWESVLSEGQQIFVRDVNGITSGGESEECWDTVSASVKQTAVGAVAAIPGMDWAGVDIVVENETQTPYVIEINTNAAINGSTFPVYGTPRDLGRVLWDQMYARTSPEPPQSPQTLKRLETPQPLSSYSRSSGAQTVNIRDLLAHELEKQGHRIVHHNRDVWSAEMEGTVPQWFNIVLSKNDLATALSPIRKPFLLRQILRKKKVSRPAGRRIHQVDQLEAFREKVGTTVTLMPSLKFIGRGASQLITREDSIDDSVLAGKRNWFVQARRTGLRFSIMASPYGALAIVAAPGQSQPSDNVLDEISALAVSAVRAVPHLRWAVVDVMRRYRGDETRTGPNAVVEGLSLNPTFDVTSEVVAGSLEAVVGLLVAGAGPTSLDR